MIIPENPYITLIVRILAAWAAFRFTYIGAIVASFFHDIKHGKYPAAKVPETFLL